MSNPTLSSSHIATDAPGLRPAHLIEWQTGSSGTQWERFRDSGSLGPEPLVSGSPFRAWSLQLVFAMGLVVAAAAWIVSEPLRNPSQLTTGAGEQRNMALADGSILHLDANSEARIKFTAQERRVILARGEGRFTVAKETERPFLVSTPQATVSVLGGVFGMHTVRKETTVTVFLGPCDPAAAAHRRDSRRRSSRLTDSFRRAARARDGRRRSHRFARRALAAGTAERRRSVRSRCAYGRGLQWLCNEAQHAGLCDNVADFRLCARTVRLNPLLQFMYWHMNFHTEHHLFASVPCYRLVALHRLVREQMPPSPRGLIATWRQIDATLQRQKIEPGYRFRAAIPPARPTELTRFCMALRFSRP